MCIEHSCHLINYIIVIVTELESKLRVAEWKVKTKGILKCLYMFTVHTMYIMHNRCSCEGPNERE